MAYTNQKEFIVDPSNKERQVKSTNFLPKFFRTPTNEKFLSSTMDQLLQPGSVQKLSGYIGKKEAKASAIDDNYISDVSKSREDYQLEPATVIKDSLDNVKFYKDYNDFINQIGFFNGVTNNHSRTNEQEFYAWNPHINWDKFINFREYYWLPSGPESVAIFGQSKAVESTYTITLSDQGDTLAYIFTPNGLTPNPTIKLFRGLKYRFEINTTDHPIAFATNRSFTPGEVILIETTSGIRAPGPYDDALYDGNGYDVGEYVVQPNPGGVEIAEGANTSLLYTDGVKRFNTDLEEVAVVYVENGVIEFTVPDNAPDRLYYISKNDVNVSGFIQIYDIEENTAINVETEILGKKTYTTESGFSLLNGMKVYFQGDVTPEKYATGEWYVEGVGEKITLINSIDLEIPTSYTSNLPIPFDAEPFDKLPYSDASSYAAIKDYIIINRASLDGNPWSKYNKWFHKNVIEESSKINGTATVLDQSLRAKRPIIEFNSKIKLYNFGTFAKQPVDLVDTFTTDVFSTVEGAIGYNVDGINLVNGMRVLFTADTDSLVKGKIYEVKFINFNGRTQISLVETEDTTPLLFETVLIKNGTENSGKSYYYNGDNWIKGQDKLTVNQQPLFDLYDQFEISYSDFTNTSFKGNKLFSYQIGNGPVDTELGFSLSYKGFENVGDIVFDFNLLNETYTYLDGPTQKQFFSKHAFLRKYTSRLDFTYVNGWERANKLSSQKVIRQYFADEILNSFPIDVYNRSGDLNDLRVWVYLNNRYILNDQYTIDRINGIAYIRFNNDLKYGDKVLIKTSSQTPKNNNGYYEIPINLEKNPLNNNLTEFTLGEVNNHVGSIVENLLDFQGNYPGTSNLENLGNVSKYGRTFVKHTGPLNLANLHITDKNFNIVKALRFCKDEYSKFKRIFLQTAYDLGYDGPVKQHVDLILSTMNKNKTNKMPFYFSDMAPTGPSTLLSYTVFDSRNIYYSISQPFSLDVLSNRAILVYLNGVQLIQGDDYEFNTDGFCVINATLTVNDKIDIYEYDTTDGSFIPSTPTKLGLYPSFIPKIYNDDTYSEPVKVIQGHDGSIIRAYDDYRDNLILELEKRIYNNIKQNYNEDIFDIHNFVGGEFRTTPFSREEIDQSLVYDFSRWLINVGSLDYTQNSNYSSSNTFSFNYGFMSSPSGKPLPGGWRAVYKDAYDTDRPHSHPWEILGLTEKPSWWNTVYGPEPYTSDNLILWQDIRDGAIREPGVPVTYRSKYARPTILSHLPVDNQGRLLSPLDSNYAKGYVLNLTSEEFKFGDSSTVESAWRKSSEFPYSLIIAWAINQPSKVLGLAYDISRIKRDLAGNLVYTETNEQIRLTDLIFPVTSSLTQRTYTSGLVNILYDYLFNLIGLNTDEYENSINSITTQIGFKLGGFTDKSKFRLLLDSRSPLDIFSQNSTIIPEENYKIFLNTSSPINVEVYSGLIIEKQPFGFILKGYDTDSSKFNFYKPYELNNDLVINVGGVSKTFSDWDTNKTYVEGQIVFYQNLFYRTKTRHTSTTTFDSTKFVKLPDLPVEGGRDIIVRKTFDKTRVLSIPYGYVYRTIQEVVDFMLGYQEYLVDRGFVFDYFNRESNQVEDWLYSAKEFAFWTTQNWDSNSVIALSPSATQVKFISEYSVVDDIFNNFYDYSLYKADGAKLNEEFTSRSRNDNEFSIVPKNTADGVYNIKLPLVQKEHVVLLDNQTVFNDIIYDLEPGFKQERIRIAGYRSDEWNGGFNIPGFVYDSAIVTLWEENTDYDIGTIVKYKEFYYIAKSKITGTNEFDVNDWAILNEKPEPKLLTNFDFNINEFLEFYDLDSDSFDSEKQKLAQHLIGYQNRCCLQNVINDDVSQYKFYQGFIADKGTQNALTKLFDALSAADKESLEFYEEWAIRTGQFGAVDKFQEYEYILDESKFFLSPQPIELTDVVDQNDTRLIYKIKQSETYVAPEGYTHTPFPTVDKITEYIKTAGYVHTDDPSYTFYSYNDLLTLNIKEIFNGNYVWIGNRNNDWDILKYTSTPYKVESIEVTGGNAVLNVDLIPANLNVGDIIGVFDVSDDNTEGFYTISDITYKAITLDSIDFSEEETSEARISNFISVRYNNVNTLNESLQVNGIDSDDLVWIDNFSDNWSVLKNTNVYEKSATLVNLETFDTVYDGYGESITSSSDNTVIAVGSPYENGGKVYIYTRRNESLELSYLQTLDISSTNESVGGDIRFGKSVALSPDKEWLIVGSPNTSNVKSFYTGEYDSTNTYSKHDIVKHFGALWRATINSPVDQPSTGNNNWEQIFNIEVNDVGTASALENQGMISVFKRSPAGFYRYEKSYISSETTDQSYFGSKIKITKFDDLYTLFVSSDGNNNTSNFGSISTVLYGSYNGVEYTWAENRNQNYRGIFNSSITYYENDIVSYENVFYKAVTNIAAGSVFDNLDWEEVTDNISYLGYIPVPADLSVGNIFSPENGLTIFSYDFDVSSKGDTVVVSSRSVGSDSSTGATVEIYKRIDNSFVFSQVLENGSKSNGYGQSVAISDDGQLIAVGEPFNDSRKTDQGVVYIYKQENGFYELIQTLKSFGNEANENFGYKVDFDNSQLLINSLKGDSIRSTTFDRDTTWFDTNLTRFKQVVFDQGLVYLYERFDDNLVFSNIFTFDDRDILMRRYGENVLVNNNHIYICAPNALTLGSNQGIVVNYRKPRNTTQWSTHRSPIGIVNTNDIKKIFLYNKLTNSFLSSLDYVDPIQGKIASIAEQDLFYKTSYDPALYNFSESTQNVDENEYWDERYVGRVWWDISTALFVNPYQGDTIYQMNNWNKLFVGASIDVYEWVESTLLPSEWDDVSDTEEGLASGISGTTKYGDLSYCIKRKFNTRTKSFSNYYYYWVKNSVVIPDKEFRSINCLDISRLIENPFNQSYRYASILADNRFVLNNITTFLENTDTVINFQVWNSNNRDMNIHTQYQIITDGLEASKPSTDLEEKWFDSLIGTDRLFRKVPDTTLSPKLKYGTLNRPRQGWFVNREEALKQVIERVNSVLETTLITDLYDISPLERIDPVPSVFLNLYDEEVDSVDELEFIGILNIQRAILTPIIDNGRIIGVDIVNSGKGYLNKPTYEIIGSGENAELSFKLDGLGGIESVTVLNGGNNYDNNTIISVRNYSVLVKNDQSINNRWAIYGFDKPSNSWIRSSSQSYNVPSYWNYIDWYDNGYNSFTPINFIVDETYEIPFLNSRIGDIIKIKNVGSGGWLLLEKTSDEESIDYTKNYRTIGRENGTIQFSSDLYNTIESGVGFDVSGYDVSLYDTQPLLETRIILEAIRDNLFIKELAVEYNKLFISSLRYVFSEQNYVDWAFKTSFVRAKHNVGKLSQKVTYQNDFLQAYQSYVEEVKPYKTKIREYISSYDADDNTASMVTDFDLFPYYNLDTKSIVPHDITISNNTLVGNLEKVEEYPFKNWLDHYTYHVESIEIYNGGEGYIQTPIIRLIGGGGSGATAKAYMSNGVITEIKVLSQGAGYTSAPIVEIVGNISEQGRAARASAVISNNKVRSAHLVIKFDRVSGQYYITDMNVEQNFVGTGSNTRFTLTYPIDFIKDNTTLTVDGIEVLSSEYSISNILDKSKGYDRYIGVIEFNDPPVKDSAIFIKYKKDISLLTAQDRINFFYNPTSGMFGKDLPQLMTGIDYGGVEVKSLGFSKTGGWDTQEWFTDSWDSYDSTFEDEIFILDGSTKVIDLSKPLIADLEYNIYLNNVRIDDPDLSTTTNPNAITETIVGDGITSTIDLDARGIPTEANDIIIIRKSTSDGSFEPELTKYDLLLEGGDIDYTTATGINPDEVIIDGDSFVNPDTMNGPEELIPGKVFDTLDIRVYDRIGNTGSFIYSSNFIGDGSTTVFPLADKPGFSNSVLVKINGNIVTTGYSIDYSNNTVVFDTAPLLNTQLNITVLTVAGTNILDIGTIVGDGSTLSFLTDAPYSDTINGTVQINGGITTVNLIESNESNRIDISGVFGKFVYDLPYNIGSDLTVIVNDITLTDNLYTIDQVKDEFNNIAYQLVLSRPVSTGDEIIIYNGKPKVAIEFDSAPYDGDIIEYALYDNTIDQVSVITRDDFMGDGSTISYILSKTPLSSLPLRHKLIVKIDNKVLYPGYSIRYNITETRSYTLDNWQFPSGSLTDSEVVAYLDGVKLVSGIDYQWFSATSSVTLFPGIGVNGQVLEIYLTDDGEYSLTDDVLTIKSIPSNGSLISVWQFSNHDAQEIIRKKYEVDAKDTLIEGTKEYSDYKKLTNGIISLDVPATDAQYIWIFLNGDSLTPSVDYHISDDGNTLYIDSAINQNDIIDYMYFSATTKTKSFGYRIFNDILNRVHYKRLDDTIDYTLAESLNSNDNTIKVKNGNLLPAPSAGENLPGVIFIDGERIEYLSKSENVLSQLRRGTLGTGVKDSYPAGTKVQDQGYKQTIPYQDRTLTQVFISDGSTKEYQLDFTPSSINDFEVFVGGIRMKKVPTLVFDPSIAQDSPEGDVEVLQDFTINGNVLTLKDQPADNTKITVIRKIGKLWKDIGTALRNSDNNIAQFIKSGEAKFDK